MLLLNFTAVLSAGQSDLVAECETYIIRIRQQHGDILFPESFYKAKEQFEQLRQSSQLRPLTNQEVELLQALKGEFLQLAQDAGRVEPILSDVLSARQVAVDNDASDFAGNYFDQAENELKKLAEILRKNPGANLGNRIEKNVRLYIQAQYEAIRNRLLSEVRIFIQEARDLGADKYTPATLALVEDLLRDVEAILNKRRFVNGELQDKAGRLAEESQHLLYLAQTARRIYRDDAALENFLLGLETSIQKLCNTLAYQPKFTEGVVPILHDLDMTVQQLISENQALRQKNWHLQDSLQAKNDEIRRLQQQIQGVQLWSGKLDRFKKRISGLNAAVTENESALYIRLNGLNFMPGKVNVNNGDKDKLKKLGRALTEFAGNAIKVRIIQPSSGNPLYNRQLAEERARATALFLQAEAFIDNNLLSWEGVLIVDEGEPGHAYLEIVISR